ncbi:Putative LOC101745998, partial [Caligus rogercresseyi]
LSRETAGPAGSANGRSLRSSETIYSILNTAEEYITRLGGGINGRACVLRAICEIAQNPEHEDGFLGEVANLVVNGNHGRGLTSFFHRGGSSNVYQNAYSKGSYEKNCAEFYEGCAISFFD